MAAEAVNEFERSAGEPTKGSGHSEPRELNEPGGPFSQASETDQELLKVIRPFRESNEGWTLGTARMGKQQSHRSFILNEHGRALNVFWLREGGGGRESVRAQARTGSEKRHPSFSRIALDPDG